MTLPHKNDTIQPNVGMDSLIKNPIRHKECGTVIGHYLGVAPQRGQPIWGSKWERLDGTHLEGGAPFREVCRHCQNYLKIHEVEFT